MSSCFIERFLEELLKNQCKYLLVQLYGFCNPLCKETFII